MSSTRNENLTESEKRRLHVNQLKRLEQSEVLNRGLPEAELFLSISRQWRRNLEHHIQTFAKPANLVPEIVMSLDLTVREEMSSDGTWHIILPIILKNLGERSAFETRIWVKETGGTIHFKEETTKGSFLIEPGRLIYERFPLEIVDSAKCEIVGSFRDVHSHVDLKYFPFVNWEFDLRGVTELDASFDFNQSLDPLRHWDIFATRKLQEIVNRIVAETKSLIGGKVFTLTGMRQTGKTFVIEKLQEEIASVVWNGKSKFLCARIVLNFEPNRSAFYFWEDVLVSLEKALQDSQNLVGNFKRIKQEANSEPERQAWEKCRDLIQTLRDKFDVQVVLLIDQGDKIPFDIQGLSEQETVPAWRRLTTGLKTLIKDQNAVVVIAHSFGYGAWEKYFYGVSGRMDSRDILDYKIKLYTRSECLRYLENSPLTFSQLGKECFWMLTGGHPGLMQLLVHYLYETAKQEHSSGNQARAGFVIVSEVKQTVNDILSDPMSSDYIQHLRSEFHPDELRLMETLAINNYMFSGTCFFRPDRLSKPAGWVGIDSLQAQLQKDHGYQELNLSIKDLLDRLVDKEVFEVEATGIVRWRIGFFFSMILYY